MLGNARAYRLHPVAAKSTSDTWLQLIKIIKRLKTQNIILIIYTLICTIITVVINTNIYTKIQKYKRLTLITNNKNHAIVIKTVINNDRTKPVDNTSCLHSIATPSLIV